MEWVSGKVIEQRVWAPGLFSLYVKAPLAPYVAGQFTQIALDINQKKIFRPYSLANSPTEEHLEIYYNLVPEGAFTPHLVTLKQGDTIWVGRKPAGRFVLSMVPQAPHLWLIATGTGLAAFLAFLKTPETWERFEKIVLVHSVRTGDMLTHQDLIQSWCQQYPDRFHWIPVVTREKWAGALNQRIGDLLVSGEIEKRALNISPENSQFMLCGNPEMVKEVTHYLQSRNLILNRLREQGQITVENYWK